MVTTTVPTIMAGFGRDSNQILATTTTTEANPLIDDVLSQQQQTLGNHETTFISSLELNHWAPADCTALIHALVASFSVILVSELGDKTFIITAIMAMKNSRLLVFMASALALLIMTILSVGMGVAVTVIPKVYTHYASIVLFLCFGLKMLKEAYDMIQEGEESEFDEVKRNLEEVESNKAIPNKNFDEKAKEKVDEGANELIKPEGATNQSMEESSISTRLIETLYIAPIVIKVFTMVFVAEWGDRSQISTVILAAREDVVGVFVGSFIGHVLCTGLAVIGGRFAAEMISVRTSKFSKLWKLLLLSFSQYSNIIS